MKIIIAAFGKLKTPGIRDATDYYLRNLGAWADVEELELKAAHVSDKSAATRVKIQKFEEELLFEKLQKKISPRGAIILLDEKGKAEPTQNWAKQIEKLQNEGVSEIVFCIGGSLGFSAEARKNARAVFSFGPQTLSHEIARLVLAEQLYRSFSVLNGHPYHHEG